MYKKIAIILTFTLTTLLNAGEIDTTTGLINAEGLGEVKEHCTVCHTGRFIVVNGGDEPFWKNKIRIMQNAYGLWEIEKNQEEKMIKYLSKNYAKKKQVSVNE